MTLKRTLDIAVAISMLLLLAVPFMVVIVILLLTGEREVFYFQERVGFLGKLIRVTKFVTMVKDAPNIGSQDITLTNDPRVLPVGKFLRRSKLNEIPQFWDVLTGKISLVGWRPLMPKGFALYAPEIQEVLVSVKPGLTGIGSLVFRDEESIIAMAEAEGRDLRDCYRQDIMPYKGALEVWYVANQSLWTDFKILVGTAIAIFRPGWTGYASWFDNLPLPESPLIRRHLGFK